MSVKMKTPLLVLISSIGLIAGEIRADARPIFYDKNTVEPFAMQTSRSLNGAAGYPEEILTVAQAEGEGVPAKQAALDAALKRDDLEAARDIVDRLDAEGDVSAETLRSMRDQIWRAKSVLTLRYSREITKAIAAADFEAVKSYSRQLAKLSGTAPDTEATVDQPVAEEAAVAVPRRRPAVAEVEVPGAIGEGTRDITTSTTEDERARRALDQRRLFPPADDNAFDLVARSLERSPDNQLAYRQLDEIIDERKAEVDESLEREQPERALELADQMIAAFDGFITDGRKGYDYRSKVLQWSKDIEPRLARSLLQQGRTAVEEDRLDDADDGALSARDYLDRLTSLKGQGSPEVRSLAGDVMAGYRRRIDRHLAANRFGRALYLLPGMQDVSVRFGIEASDLALLRERIESEREIQQADGKEARRAADDRRSGGRVAPSGSDLKEEDDLPFSFVSPF